MLPPRLILLALVVATSPLFGEDGITEAERASKSNPVFAFPAWSGPCDALRSWGDVSERLQMATFADSKCAVIHVWLRNALANEIVYNDYFLGHWECVSVEVKRGEKWIGLERRKDPKRFYMGIGPGEKANKSLSSMAIVPPASKSSLVRERFNVVTDTPEFHQPQFAELALKGFTFSSLVWRNDLPVPPTMPGTTFQVDLADFTWPDDFLKGETLTLRVTQGLAQPKSLNRTFHVVSPEMKIDPNDLKSFLNLLAKTPAPKK